jgi:S1-C subfamily serine protease
MKQTENQDHDDQSIPEPIIEKAAEKIKFIYPKTKEHHSTAFSLPPELINRPRSEFSVKYLSVAFLAILGLTAGFFGGWLGADNHDQSSSLTSPIETKQTVVSSTSQVISSIAKTVGESVVSVNVTSQTASPDISNFFSFGIGGTNGTTEEQDSGTGIILSADGLIITNRHVIPDGTTSVSVTLSDGTTYNNVQVIGRTSDSDSLDIAFLKIQNLNGKKLIPATIGDSSQMQVGDAVVAIGNALGQFQNTVTSGIISGYGRSISASDSSSDTTSENLVDMFQTDAAINEGNSGGPLVNLSGQVIGINTAIAGNAQNIGFAIPINDVVGLIKSVEQTGKLEQPYLGIIYIPITSDVVQQYSLSVNNGAYIPLSSDVGEQTILTGSPAAQAGLQEGDIITAIDGTPINESNSLTSILDQDSVGQVVTLTVNRGGKTISIKVTLGVAPTS